MSIGQKIEDDIKTAMRAGERDRLGCLRMLKSKIQEKQVALRSKEGPDYRLSDDEALAVIAAYAKQRRDSIESYEKGGREELAARERAELEIVSSYLPRQLDEAEVRTIVAESIAESGATSARDMGAVMKLVMPRVKGLADGKLVQRIVRESFQAG